MTINKGVLIAPVVAVVILVSALISGHIDINLEHHLRLPKELTNANTIVSDKDYWSGRTISDVYLKDEITDSKNVRDVVILLNSAKEGDEIIFHIAGNGGDVDTTLLLVNKVITTKAYTVMIVERPSYSGHALLAVSGSELIMLPYTYLLFHTSSAFNQDCSKATGQDRAMTEQETCQLYINAHLESIGRMILESRIPLLTTAERIDVVKGKTIVIDYSTYLKRKDGNFN